MESNTLNKLFPSPKLLNSSFGPVPVPGRTPASTVALIKLLKSNHEAYHIFFNDSGFHNHMSHHLLAAYALGATPELLQEIYDLHAEYQRPKGDGAQPITEDNWMDYLNHRDRYSDYLKFFTDQLLKSNLHDVIERFCFSDESKPAKMLSRLLSGLLHPLIHIGYGLEFGLPGIVAEGLAMAATTGDQISGLVAYKRDTSSSNKHVLDIVSSILHDDSLAYGAAVDPQSSARLTDLLKTHTDRVTSHLKNWNPDGTLDDKYQQVIWLAVVLYGIGGWQNKDKFQANFFMVHILNATLFLPSFFAHLKLNNQEQLLRAFVDNAVAVWISQGRTDLPIVEFYSQTGAYPLPPHQDPTPGKKALASGNLNQNGWFGLLQSSLNHPDEHLLKALRALSQFAAHLGATDARKIQSTLPGADVLDGTLFLRVAGLSNAALGWVREGEPEKEWNRRYDKPKSRL